MLAIPSSARSWKRIEIAKTMLTDRWRKLRMAGGGQQPTAQGTRSSMAQSSFLTAG
jgi:hypothetical protein